MNCNKLKLILAVLVSLTFVEVNGQGFRAGVIAGLSATQISGDNLGGYDKAGLIAGGMVSTELSRKLDLAMEIIFIQKGSKKNPNPDNGDYSSYFLRLNYFEVPLLLKWKYSKRFTFEVGPTFGYLISVTEENELGEIPYDPPRPFDKFELGITGGMRVHFAQKFSFAFRVSSSVLPVRPHQSGQSYQLNYGQYNAVLMFGLQYTFMKPNE